MRYINFKYENQDIETIEECKTFKDARYLLKEYKLADRSGSYWISQRKVKGN